MLSLRWIKLPQWIPCPRPAGRWVCLFFVAMVFAASSKGVLADETKAFVPNPELLEMLDASGVDASLRVYLKQDSPWDVENDEILVKILHRLPDFPRMMTESWAFPWSDDAVKTIEADPEAWQGQFFRLHFQVLTLHKISLPPEAADRFGFAEYYRVEVVTVPPLQSSKESSQKEPPPVVAESNPITIFTRTVPTAWQEKLTTPDKPVPINQAGSAVAMFLKTGSKGPKGGLPLYFATDRVAWHPETTLGRLGMDVGLFDLVQDRRKIDAKERETFYQLLATVGRAKRGSLLKEAKEELGKDKDGHQKWTTAASLFNQPERMRGKLVLLKGHLRRAIRVEVRDPDIVQRFGIRYYYELYLFTSDSQSNPIVVCARALPKGMPIGSGTGYNQPIEVAGIMLKSWAFTSGGDRQKGGQRQLAPLLIADRPVWVRQMAKPDSFWGEVVTMAGLVVGLFLLWYFLRRQAKADRAARRRRQNLSFLV